MVFMIEGGVMFDWSKPQVAVQIDRTRAILIDGRSGIEVGTTFSGIDVGFLAAFDAMFAGAVA
jgi:hypothetical protein